jgi:FkbM family methyltransferase
MLQKLKQALVGTSLGRVMITARNKVDILSAAIHSPESVGTIANDQLASSLLPKLCRPGKTFIDVGAHIGSVIADVIHHDDSINIIAFEAIPEKTAALQRKFQRVKIFQCAVGDRDGFVSFFINTRKSGYSSLGKSCDSTDLKEITVPMRRIDDWVQRDDVDAIKIDVEGAELGVLLGAKKLIEKSRPVIMFESGPMDNGLGYTKEGIWNFFNDINYTLHAPNRVAHNDEGLNLYGFIDGHVYPRRATNYFAIPKEKRDEIRERATRQIEIDAPDRSLNIDY